MAKLRLNYPVICFNTLIVDVSDEQAENVQNMNLDSQADFIIEQDIKADTLHMVVDHKHMVAALDIDFATIRRVSQ